MPPRTLFSKYHQVYDNQKKLKVIRELPHDTFKFNLHLPKEKVFRMPSEEVKVRYPTFIRAARPLMSAATYSGTNCKSH